LDCMDAAGVLKVTEAGTTEQLLKNAPLRRERKDR